MLDFTHIQLSQLVLHQVGNHNEDEGVLAAKQLFDLSDEALKELLLRYFLDSFKQDAFYQFNHSTDLEMNEVYMYCKHIFENSDDLYTQSRHILEHLYQRSDHPKIKGGELYVAYFKDILVEDELVDAVGIFKAETKDTYLKLRADEQGNFYLAYDEGTSISKLDKGALILNAYAEEGYRVITVDLKSTEAKFWRDKFLEITEIQDQSFHTKTYLNLCKDFCKEVYAEEEDKKEQVTFLNKSMEYFNTKDEFDIEEFKEEVIQDEGYVEKFEAYRNTYQEQNGIEDTSAFFISQPTVKKMKRSFKNVIQLDTQIEVKIHSSEAEQAGHIERGFDEERGMHYYKVYFNQEK